MSLKIKVSNTGDSALSNIRIAESHPDAFTIALQGQTPSPSTLAKGQSNILILDTANTCTDDSSCSSNEKCVGTGQKYCRIDISNLLGDYTFGLTIQANYTDAYGVIAGGILTVINLPITFQQDEVIFRTNAVNGVYTGGTRIVVDRAGDGELENYGDSSSGGSGAYYPADFLAYTPQGKLVYKCGTSTQVCVSSSTTLDKTVTQTSVTRMIYGLGGTLPTTKTPTEPYLSQNCGGIKPCQEMYSIIIAPPSQTCSDSLKNQDETDTDCGGLICSACPNTKACLINTDCTSGNCTGNICQGVAVQNVKLRISDLGYGSTSAIGFTSTCGNTLTRYGYSSSSGILTGVCASIMPTKAYCGTSNTLLLSDLAGGWRSGGEAPSLWQSSTSGMVCVCDSGDDGDYTIKRYTATDSDRVNVDESSASINPSYELVC